jgi:hypothetical protein
MAKLSAHGDEVARLDITRTVPDAEYRIVYSFRSDGHVMRRMCSTDRAGFDGGWKLYKKLKDPKRDTVRRMRRVAQQFVLDYDPREDTTINDFNIYLTA